VGVEKGKARRWLKSAGEKWGKGGPRAELDQSTLSKRKRNMFFRVRKKRGNPFGECERVKNEKTDTSRKDRTNKQKDAGVVTCGGGRAK